MKKNLPPHLAMKIAQGYASGEPIAQFEIGTMKNFIYLILDSETKTAAIVDPQKDLSRPLAVLEEQGFKLTHLLLTHTHFDHTAGVLPLLTLMPDLEICVGELDLHRVPKSVVNSTGLKLLKNDQAISVGSFTLQAIHTPGHSAGEFSYFLPLGPGVDRPYLFTGDTIFIRDCGRTDFEDGSNEQMFASIQKMKRLPKETVFLVGHHYAEACATTLEAELQESPPFRCQSVEELAALP